MPEPGELARRFVPGTGEPQILPLSVGLASRTFRVRRDGASFVLRAAGGPPAPPFDPAYECRVLALAAAAGLAPETLVCDAVAGVLVTRWVEGAPWSAVEAASPDRFAEIAGLLRRIHALPAPAPARIVAPAGWIRCYGGAGPEASEAARSRLAALARLDSGPLVVCHSDLHRLNLLDGGGRLVVLDWEYAHVADRFWDLAGWLSANDLDACHGAALLGAYLGREASAAELSRLGLLGWLYDYVAYLWCGVQAGRVGETDGGPLTVRARQLLRRLE